MSPLIRIALVGLGNCAKSLVESLVNSKSWENSDASAHIGRSHLGGFTPADIELVAAFDIDARKVGSDVAFAVQAAPNSARPLGPVPQTGVKVHRGPTLDGCPQHLRDLVIESPERSVSREVAVQILKESGVDVGVVLVPTGSHEAVEWWAETFIEAKVSMINGVPTFLAQRPDIIERFERRTCCYVGDDLKSQLGATILHRALLQLCRDQGVTVLFTSQLNVGGNADFRNLDYRGVSKAHSKSSSLRAIVENISPQVGFEYSETCGDHKTAKIVLEGENWCGAPFSLRATLEVEDSPNSVAPLVDAIRCVAAARARGICGYLSAASARLMKSPRDLVDELSAIETYEHFISELS